MKKTWLLIHAFQNVLIKIGCGCNLVGTRDSSGRCNVQTGLCICNAGLGYTGDKCDDCLDGWYLNDSDNTCTSKIIRFSKDANVSEENVCLSGCDCNLSGTIGGSPACDETGLCTCDASQGYSGGDNGKCDDCLDGWFWTTSNSTCTSKNSPYFYILSCTITMN